MIRDQGPRNASCRARLAVSVETGHKTTPSGRQNYKRNYATLKSNALNCYFGLHRYLAMIGNEPSDVPQEAAQVAFIKWNMEMKYQIKTWYLSCTSTLR